MIVDVAQVSQRLTGTDHHKAPIKNRLKQLHHARVARTVDHRRAIDRNYHSVITQCLCVLQQRKFALQFCLMVDVHGIKWCRFCTWNLLYIAVYTNSTAMHESRNTSLIRGLRKLHNRTVVDLIVIVFRLFDFLKRRRNVKNDIDILNKAVPRFVGRQVQNVDAETFGMHCLSLFLELNRSSNIKTVGSEAPEKRTADKSCHPCDEQFLAS